MRKLNLLLPLFVLFLLLSCQKESVEPDKQITSSDLNFNVSFEESFENTLYPSLVLGLAGYSAREQESINLLSYSWINPKNECEFSVRLKPSELTNESMYNLFLEGEGKDETASPQISWDYDNLKKLTESGTTDLNFACFIDGKEIDNKTLKLNYRSVNECIWGYLNSDDEFQNLTWMFAGYVNEDHQLIDGVLRDVLNTGAIGLFDGYQSDNARGQVYALWHYFQLQGVKYSSITNTSNPSDRVLTQHVRFFEEVLNNNQANCVDGTVFFSSLLKKIGIKPFLVLVPGHMYLGYYTDSDKSHFDLLETTSIGQFDLKDLYEEEGYVYNLNKFTDYLTQETVDNYFSGGCSLDYVKKEISMHSFYDALDFQVDNWNSYFNKFNDATENFYQVIDIEEYREFVQPIK